MPQSLSISGSLTTTERLRCLFGTLVLCVTIFSIHLLAYTYSVKLCKYLERKKINYYRVVTESNSVRKKKSLLLYLPIVLLCNVLVYCVRLCCEHVISVR